MNKVILFFLLLSSAFVFSQTKKERPTLESFQKKYRYVKNRSYTGPEGGYNNPASMEVPEEEYPQSNSSSKSNGGKIEYSPEEIERIRKQNAQRQQGGSGGPGNDPGAGSGGGNGKGNGGNQPKDPKMGQPKPIEFDPPDIKTPDIDLPDVKAPSISAGFWKVFLIVLGAIVLLILIYYLVKNHRPTNKKVKPQGAFENWNPEVISKTELELRLEKAMADNDFRECVRIYFTFILKEMIRLRFIQWKKELTNFDYLIQASSKPNFAYFEQSVRIYDLVWYGDYDISLQDYKSVEKHLEQHYKLLNSSNA